MIYSDCFMFFLTAIWLLHGQISGKQLEMDFFDNVNLFIKPPTLAVTTWLSSSYVQTSRGCFTF